MQLSTHGTESDWRQITQLLVGNEIPFAEEPSESHRPCSISSLLLAGGMTALLWGPGFTCLPDPQPFWPLWLTWDTRHHLSFFPFAWNKQQVQGCANQFTGTLIFTTFNKMGQPGLILLGQPGSENGSCPSFGFVCGASKKCLNVQNKNPRM